MLARTLSPEGGWIVRATSVGEKNEAFFIRVWKPLPSTRVLKILSGSPKRTISASGGLDRLHLDLFLFRFSAHIISIS